MNFEKLLSDRIEVQGKSRKTFVTYWYHCDRFLKFCKSNGIGKETRAEVAVERWLTHLAVEGNAAKNSQNLALQAVCYLYREVLKRPLVGVNAFRAKKPQMVKDVISVEDVAGLFAELQGPNLLAAKLMYATGLRVGLVSELRIKDFLFERNQILVHSAKGDKGRYVSFPEAVHEPVRHQMESVRVLHRWDSDGNNPNGVSLPDAFRKKSPKSANHIGWQYLFPADNLSFGPEKVLCRHHRLPDGFTDAIRDAAERAGIENRVTSHTLRHCYATHSLELGVSIATLQQLLGHNDPRTTMIYLHADKNGVTSAKSPIELLPQPAAKTLKESLETPSRKPVAIPKTWRVVG